MVVKSVLTFCLLLALELLKNFFPCTLVDLFSWEMRPQKKSIPPQLLLPYAGQGVKEWEKWKEINLDSF